MAKLRIQLYDKDNNLVLSLSFVAKKYSQAWLKQNLYDERTEMYSVGRPNEYGIYWVCKRYNPRFDNFSIDLSIGYWTCRGKYEPHGKVKDLPKYNKAIVLVD